MKKPDLQRLKEVEEENRKLKRLLVDSLPDNDALKAFVHQSKLDTSISYGTIDFHFMH